MGRLFHRFLIRFVVATRISLCIESLFFAFLLGFTLKDNGVSLLLCLAGGIALILLIKVLFRFRLGYFLVSAAFSAFWAMAFSSGWLRDGNWLIGGGIALVIFAACLYGHKLNYEEEKNREDE